MQWTHPDTVGDLPPPCRTQTATLYYDRNFVFLGVVGAQSTMMYFLDTTTRRWTRLIIQSGDRPGSRRAHSALYYKGKVWIFGGNVLSAFNDVWTLDVSGRAGFDGAKPMR